MKYIKWQDELESYLYSIPREEKEKAFSYFSEMYADKREAGLSEEEIVESFGPPYDVAKRILSESGQPADSFYGAPPENYAPRREYAPPVYPDRDYSDRRARREYIRHDCPPPAEEVAPKKKNRSFGHLLGGLILAIILFSLSATLIGVPVGLIVDGFTDVGAAIGAMVAGSYSGAEGATAIGGGIMLVGGAFIALAPVGYIVAYMWKKFKEWF